MTDPLLMATDSSECAGGDAKISSGTKRPVPEFPVRSNTKSAHVDIVYVRRKTDATGSTKTKTNVCATTQTHSVKKSTSDQPEKTTPQVAQDVAPPTTPQVTQDVAPPTTQQVTQNVASPPRRASSPSFSSTRRSVSPSLGNISSSEENTHVSSSNPPLSEEGPKTYWEDRYSRLQSLLKMLDQSDRRDYVQMLRSMSSVELSRHAAELEERSFKISEEEAKEIERVKLYDVLGKYGKNAPKASSSQQEQLQK